MKDVNLKKQMAIFLAITFGVQYLMAIPLYIAKTRGMDIGIFPLISMHLPAAGVMVAMLITRKKDKNLPRFFYDIYLINLIIIITLSLLPFFNGEMEISGMISYVCILFSVISWIGLLVSGKEKRKYYGLNKAYLRKTMLVSLIFTVIYFIRVFGGMILEGEDWSYLLDVNKIIMAFGILFTFFISFLPFLGEEYGWRYYFQPILQEKFGMVKGVIILGALWGVWHLPLNLFFYAAEGSGILSLLNQIANCVTLSIFMAYAYNKTKSIWAPTLIHYINNNFMILLVKDLSEIEKIGQNIDYTIFGVIFTLVFGIIFFGAFVFSKYVRKEEYRMPNANEMADEAYKELEKDNLEIV